MHAQTQAHLAHVALARRPPLRVGAAQSNAAAGRVEKDLAVGVSVMRRRDTRR
jgi:hypothetical protein